MLGLNYTYLSLTSEQVAARRHTLDIAGLRAYLLPLVLLTTVYIHRTWFGASSTKSKTSFNDKPVSSRTWTRRLHWTLTTTAIGDFGPLNTVLIMLAYSTVLVSIIFHGTGNDYMHLTKSLSHVTVAQLPLHYLLSIKSLQSPITVATGLTHERLNDYHRLFGRIIHTLLAAHALMYLKFFIDLNILTKRLRDWDVQTGLVAFIAINLLGLLSLPAIRKALYHRIFYRSHIVLSASLLLVVWFHVPYTRIYVAQSAIFWILNAILRQKDSVDVEVTCHRTSPNLLTLSMTTSEARMHQYTPGMHIYLNAKQFIGPRTPFTVSHVNPLDHGKVEVKLVAKISGGPQTTLLAEAAGSTTRKIMMQLEGPYGEAGQYLPCLLSGVGQSNRCILIVCGGVGATYGLSVWQALCRRQQQQHDQRTRTTPTTALTFIWLVHDPSDLDWAEPLIRGTLQSSFNNQFKIYITGTPSTATSAVADLSILSSQVTITRCTARPNLSHLLAPFFSESPPEQSTKSSISDTKVNIQQHAPLTILTCGPSTLTISLKHLVGSYTRTHSRAITFHEEQFGFGG